MTPERLKALQSQYEITSAAYQRASGISSRIYNLQEFIRAVEEDSDDFEIKIEIRGNSMRGISQIYERQRIADWDPRILPLFKQHLADLQKEFAAL